MWDDCYEGKSLLSPESTSKLCLSITHVFQNWLESLPEEIIPTILIRLPIKSLIRFSSVCKSWRSIIKDPSFIRTHLTHTLSLNDQNATHLILLHNYGSKEDSYSLHYDKNEVSQYCNIEYPIGLKNKMKNSCCRVVGTCDGLVLLADDLGNEVYNFVIWNPSIRKYVILPKPSVRFSTHGNYEANIGLGYDAIGNDYKLVRVTSLVDQPDHYPRTLVQYYSLATGSWGMLRLLPPCLVNSSRVQVLVNGALHWLAICWTNDHQIKYVVMAFDVGGQPFREIMLPESLQLDELLEFRLGVSGDRKSIGLFVRCKSETNCFLDIWVMKEYCVEKSWTKLMILTPQGPNRSLPKALCFRRSGEVVLILEDDHELVSIEIVSKQFKNLGISAGQVCFVDSYEESLLLLDRKDAISY
ncbi:putative F-box domain-containing protein [Rosa chinensis]|uniref:Putative F-box domain-containing protein n=1 Tax=Rosa chinensis TaxID=74649 RepID=A0A2P6QA79_ROSCH|nr:F-box/kelch-repeat protein At3g23880 [Rosa chinensis]XP_040375378.1 F-box/kelch-repeat protein At3g23880 [Rosa chinensis]PRQ31095.1 putative F-box domain-containing protein [Rosa chinensis]